MEIYIVRHGLSEANEKNVLQGQIDYPLSDEGRRQAHHIGNYFGDCSIKFNRAVTSVLSRAKETAEIILKYQDDPPILEDEEKFKEIDIGKLQGFTSDEVRDKFPDYYKRGPNEWLDFSEYGGETWVDLCNRVDIAMSKYVTESKMLEEGNLLIVAHGGVLRAMLRTLLSAETNFMFLRVENCCHVKINYLAIRGHLRKYIEYIMPLENLIVNGKRYSHGISDDHRANLVS